MTCHIQETFSHECGHCLSDVTHCHVCPLFGGADQRVCSEGLARCQNVRTRLTYEAGHCSLCRARDEAENSSPLSRGLDHRFPTALIEERRVEFTVRLQEQADRDRTQPDARAIWYAEQELDRLLQAEDGVHPLQQTYVFDPEHHPESSPFLQKVQGFFKPCPICRVLTSVSRDARKLPCGHAFHYKCILPWFLDLEQSRCPMCNAEFQIVRSSAFSEESPSGGLVEDATAPVVGLSFPERVASLRWKQ
jgi:hypothetical protein